jgi:outer membrane protein OmpA-like peptidoglycan-associated protein
MRKFTLKASALVLGLTLLAAPSLFAQPGTSETGTSTTSGSTSGMTNVPKKRQDQQRDYENGKYPFPAKKLNNWAVGLQVGVPFVGGDIDPQLPSSLGFGLNVRKAFGHTFSLRLQGVYSQARGLSASPASTQLSSVNDATNGRNNPNANYASKPNDSAAWFPNHSTTMLDGSLQGVVHLNNINFYNKQTRWGIYGFAGIGGALYNTKVDALNGSTAYYLNDIQTNNPDGTNRDEADIKADVKDKLDGEYETAGQGFTAAEPDAYNWRYQWVAGGGLTYRLSRRLDLSLEHRVSGLNDDYLDGKKFSALGGRLLQTTDFDNYNFTSLGLSVKIGGGEESLWWANPLNAVYEQVADASKRIKDATTDTDGDGVADVFDREPGTAPGAIVDTHGVTRDDDKDGVPNHLDDEPFSEPGAIVDARGVGKPRDYKATDPIDPNDLKNPYNPNSPYYKGAMAALGGGTPGQGGSGAGSNWFLPIIHFDLDRSEIKPEYYPELFQVATVMKNYPGMKVTVIGHTDIRASESYNQGLSQRRAQAAIDHLVKKYGIDRSRLTIEAKGETSVMVPGLPDSYVPSKERAQLVNRRVEFRSASTGSTSGSSNR